MRLWDLMSVGSPAPRHTPAPRASRPAARERGSSSAPRPPPGRSRGSPIPHPPSFTVPRGRLRASELLDEPGQPLADVRASLRDVRRINRFLGGTSVTLGHLRRCLGRVPASEPVRVLDLATGSADIPRAAVRWARREGRCLEYTCLDANQTILSEARRGSAGYPEIRFALGDARSLPFRDGSVHLATCSLALHHFDPEDAVRILSEMDRVSSVGLIVNDLRRSRVACFLIRLLTELLRANRLTRHDGPVSTLRAYTPLELRDLAREAGLEASVNLHPFYRMALVRCGAAGEAATRGRRRCAA